MWYPPQRIYLLNPLCKSILQRQDSLTKYRLQKGYNPASICSNLERGAGEGLIITNLE